ncbi:MAG TPA: SPOR domain-containing protein, partial [Gemmatimonadales bacterium]
GAAAAAARLGAQPDAAIVLARDGAGGPLAPELPLLGVVREGDPAAAIVPPRPRPARLRRIRPAWLAGGLALAGALGWSLVAMAREPRHDRAPAPPPVAALRADSAPWTIQLAAYTTPARAVAAADRLSAGGIRVFVSPVSLDASAAVWYRVLAGAYPTRDAAAAARSGLWRDGLAARGEGALLRAPYSFRLAPPAPVAPDSLKRLGLVGIAWGQPGTWLLGAFETPEQGSFAAAALRRAGLDIALVTRTGTTP